MRLWHAGRSGPIRNGDGYGPGRLPSGRGLGCPSWSAETPSPRSGSAAVILAAVAACAPADETIRPQRRRRPRRPAARARPAACDTRTAGQAHHRHRQPGVRAVVRRQQAGQRQGLRVRGRVQRRRASSATPAANVTWTQVHVQQRDRARAEGVRLRHQPVLHHRRAQAGGRLLRRRTTWCARRSSRPRARRSPGATTLADLKDAKLGAQVGTTSLQAITEVIKPTTQPQVFNNNDDAKKALQNGTDRRPRGGPADRVLHDRRRARRRRDRRPAAAGRRARAVRPACWTRTRR